MCSSCSYWKQIQNVAAPSINGRENRKKVHPLMLWHQLFNMAATKNGWSWYTIEWRFFKLHDYLYNSPNKSYNTLKKNSFSKCIIYWLLVKFEVSDLGLFFKVAEVYIVITISRQRRGLGALVESLTASPVMHVTRVRTRWSCVALSEIYRCFSNWLGDHVGAFVELMLKPVYRR